MKNIKISFLLILALLQISCSQGSKSNDQSKQTIENRETSNKLNFELNQYLEKVISKHEIPGIAIAIEKNGKIIFEEYKGIASIDYKNKVNHNTLFRLYSTTKLITVVALFKLMEDGKIKLNDSISSYLDDLPNKWRNIKIHQLIAHSSGLPDLVNYDYSLSDKEVLQLLFQEELVFEAGEKFSYNQTNYWFLSKIIEEVSNLKFEDYINKTQFGQDKKSLIFSSNHSETIKNKAPLNMYNSETNKYEQVLVDFGNRANSASGLHLSLQDFMNWNSRLDENILLNENSKQLMWKSYEYKNNDEFLFGWGTYENNSVGFTGSGVTAFRKYLKEDMTIIFLSNGFNKEGPVHNEIVDNLAKIVNDK